MEKKLSGYAILAAASGVAMLALAPSAEAKVVYTPTHQKLRQWPSLNLFSYEAVIPKRGVLQPREGPPIDTASERSFVPHEKRLHSG